MRDLALTPHIEVGLLCCGESLFIYQDVLCKINESDSELFNYSFDIYREDSMNHYIPYDGGFFDGTAVEVIEEVMDIVDLIP